MAGFDASKVGGLVKPAVNAAGDAVKKAATAGKIKSIKLKVKLKGSK
jgi:hypothetical protein